MRGYLLLGGGIRTPWLRQAMLVTVGIAMVVATFLPSLGVTTAYEVASMPVPTATPKPIASPTPSPTPTSVSSSLAAAGTKGSANGSVLAASTGGMAFGIASDLPDVPADQLNARLDGIKALGVTWVRYDVEWSNIQYAGSGSYDWSDYDRVVQAVNARGLKSLAIIDYTPAWARQSACSDTAMCAPASPAAYATFAAAVVARYAPQGVGAYEIWNEPNNAEFFQPAANVATYAAMLKDADAAIKQVDPSVFVLTAGLSPADSSGGNISPPDFLRGIYADGGQGYFNGVGDHPYTWPYSPAFFLPGNAWDELATLHGIMTAHGDGGKQIWITEYGAPTGGPGGLASNGFSTSEGGDDHVTEALQSKMVTDAINGARAEGFVGAFFWYSYQDDGTTNDTVENFFGLLRADGSRKPAYYTFQSLIGG